MSAAVEKTIDAASTAVNDVTNALANTSLTDKAADDKSAANDAVLASAAEGRRLYIGNLAYATTEGELKDFFKGYLVYVLSSSRVLLQHHYLIHLAAMAGGGRHLHAAVLPHRRTAATPKWGL